MAQSDKVLLKNGTSTEVASYTPDSGELIIISNENRLSIGDGITTGGNKVATRQEVDAVHSDINGKLVTESHTSLTYSGNTLHFTNENGVVTDISLTSYMDNTNLSRIISGSVDVNGMVTLTRSDNSNISIDMNLLLDDTKLSKQEILNFGFADDTLSNVNALTSGVISQLRGPTGYTGSAGINGTVGYKGSTGDRGPTGPTGYTGSIGYTGATGYKGSTGAAGSTGATGPAGANSTARGATGAKGNTGARGATGTAGNGRGPTGNKGATSTVTGARGATGGRGPTGNRGATGPVGYKGSRGPTGYKGSVGYTGATGAKGATGSRGPTGVFYPNTVKAVNAYNHNSDVYTQIAKIQASDKQTGDNFGYSVAVSNSRIVVGADLVDTSGINAGAAYIFDINGNQIAKIHASDPQLYDRFGDVVAISDNRIVVGATYKNGGGFSGFGMGAVYIYDINGKQIAKIQASDKQAGDNFGTAVAVSNSRIVVGAQHEDTGGADAGAAYIFDINGNQIAKIQASDKQASDNFGYGVAVSNSRIVVGAYLEDTGGSNVGAAYIFNNFSTKFSDLYTKVFG